MIMFKHNHTKESNMEIKSSTKARSGFLDMLKMICVIMVIITHVSWAEEDRTFFIFPFFVSF